MAQATAPILDSTIAAPHVCDRMSAVGESGRAAPKEGGPVMTQADLRRVEIWQCSGRAVAL